MKMNEALATKLEKYAPSIFGEIEAKEKAEIQAERTTKADELAKVEMDTHKQILMLVDEQGKAEAETKAAEAVLKEKQQALAKVKSSLWSVRSRGQNQAGKLKQYLTETASPALDEAIQFFNDKLSWLRQDGRIRHDMTGGETNLIFWKKKVKAESNKNAVLSAMRYCQDAIETLGDWKLIPELDPAEIERLKAEIPSVDDYEEITGEKPLDRIAGPLAGFPSGSQTDWEVGKLLEKGNRALKKAR
jgi:hypothetical protein